MLASLSQGGTEPKPKGFSKKQNLLKDEPRSEASIMRTEEKQGWIGARPAFQKGRTS